MYENNETEPKQKKNSEPSICFQEKVRFSKVNLDDECNSLASPPIGAFVKFNIKSKENVFKKMDENGN